MTEKMLVDKTEYLTAGIHIGMKSCTPYMKQFVYKVRDDGLSVFNLKMVDERIKTGIQFLSQFKKVLVTSRKEGASKPISMFAELVGATAIAGRFSPGTLTNPSYKDFFEPDLVFVVDPLIDDQAINEAKKKKIPVMALADTFNNVRDVDFIIPMNNNGKRALALVFMILSRELLKIKGDKEFKYKIEDFGG